MKAITVKFDLELPDDGYEYEFVRYGLPKVGELFLSHSNIIIASNHYNCNKYIILRRLEPALELETDIFLVRDDKISPTELKVDNDGDLLIFLDYVTEAEARDLAKILNYYAEFGKLPERVKVKV